MYLKVKGYYCGEVDETTPLRTFKKERNGRGEKECVLKHTSTTHNNYSI